jgi:hypothetical protein
MSIVLLFFLSPILPRRRNVRQNKRLNGQTVDAFLRRGPRLIHSKSMDGPFTPPNATTVSPVISFLLAPKHHYDVRFFLGTGGGRSWPSR